MPPEYISSNNQPRPRNNSGLKIEDKLMNNQIAANKRLEALKKSLEQEQMRELRSKPKISEKSRILAEKHERKFFQQFPDTKAKEKPVQPSYSYVAEVVVKEQLDKKSRETSEKCERKKKRTKSLLSLSVVERNEAWLTEKNSKIVVSKKIKEEEALLECTFSPKTQNRQNRSVRDTSASNNMSYISTPLSAQTFDSREFQPKLPQKQSLYCPIAPFQVKVAFKSGLDIQSFLRRAK